MQILISIVLVGLGFVLAWAMGFMKGPGKGAGDGGDKTPKAVVAPAQPTTPASVEPELRVVADGLEWQGTITPFAEAEKLLATIRTELGDKKLRVYFTPNVDHRDEEVARRAIREAGISYSKTESRDW
jgi:hypothetical protein